MIQSDLLNPLIISAFTREITWLEASTRHPLDEFIETFYRTRARTQETLENLTDHQAAFILPDHSLWSMSESVTHLTYTQGFYHNKLVQISTSQLPHAVEAARGFGEGARQNVPVETLKQSMSKATIQIRVAIEGTRNTHTAERTEVNAAFGVCNYKTWMLLMLAHEVDHLRQLVAMRRLARTNT